MTVAHRINAERLALLGWSRAIVLQMAHPLIAAGVAEHSEFRAGAAAAAMRLHGTVRAMLSLTFGDPRVHAQAIATIRAIHRRVQGTLREDVGRFPAGTPYSAEDPALLLWVHATLIESVVLAYETFVGPLAPVARDEYCREASGVAIELGANADEVPTTWAVLQQYLSSMHASGTLAAGADATAIVQAVLFPPMSVLTGPVAWLNRLFTIGTLPPVVREQFRFRWTDSRERHLRRMVAVLRTVRRGLPRWIAWWPAARRV